eukprot:TRINITY_DN51527_c0_g1_i1.p1 TRINITY_DN51527_c0_g1~~TRINITY_DN51527_c0_g1_i1.p1  ORF type:complete len:301 (+),score=79.16 TRINITY_DN51527_c0_g1_i1:38-940(+)
MSVEFLVCQDVECKSRGSALLLQDIEELCFAVHAACAATAADDDVAEAHVMGCFGHCANGPNVQVRSANKKKVLHNHVSSFETAERIVVEELKGGAELPAVVREVARLKYDARRHASADVRSAKIQEGLALLGGEDAAADEQPRLLAELRLLRAQEIVKTGRNAEDARRDAEAAVSIMPDSAHAQLALGAALEAVHDYAGAAAAVEEAMTIGRGVDLREARRWLSRLNRQAAAAKEQQPSQAATGTAATSSAATSSRRSPQESKPKAVLPSLPDEAGLGPLVPASRAGPLGLQPSNDRLA